MRRTKIVVGKGKSVPVGGPDGEWLKVFYEIHATLDEGEDPAAARLGIEQMLDQWLQGELAGLEAAIPKLDLAELDASPWLSYKTKEPAAPSKPAWMKNPVYFTQFEPPQVVFELVKALKRTPDEKLVLGDCEYSFSGKGDMEDHFISRRPVKVK